MDVVCRDSFRVRFFDTDPRGRASAPALCRYLQEAADTHCRPHRLSVTDLLAEGRMWVLSRLAARFSRLPLLGEEVAVETWGSNRLGGLRAYRDFRMLDGAEQSIGEASSMWLILDPATRRPLRLPASVHRFRHPEWKTAQPVDAVRLEAPPNNGRRETFRVGWRDLDVNRHTNNVRYLEWMIEALPESVYEQCDLAAFDIQFLGESHHGQDITSVADASSDGESFRHSLRAADDSLLALARTEWRLSWPVQARSV